MLGLFYPTRKTLLSNTKSATTIPAYPVGFQSSFPCRVSTPSGDWSFNQIYSLFSSTIKTLQSYVCIQQDSLQNPKLLYMDYYEYNYEAVKQNFIT